MASNTLALPSGIAPPATTAGLIAPASTMLALDLGTTTGWALQPATGPIVTVHFEEVRRHLGTDAAHIYGGLLAVLGAWGEELGIAYQGVPVGTIKRFIAGKGNADKAAVITAVQAKGFDPADDNEADAIAILLWAIETRGGVR